MPLAIVLGGLGGLAVVHRSESDERSLVRIRFGSATATPWPGSAAAVGAAPAAGRQAGLTLEEGSEVRGVGEADVLGAAGSGQVGVGEQPLGLQQDAPVEELLGAQAGGGAGGAGEGAPVIAEGLRVVVDMVVAGEVRSTAAR